MTQDDLLDELRSNVLRDEEGADSLWTDETLIRYLNDAYEEFAETTLIIRDKTTPDITQLILVVGQTDYVLNNKILVVYSARFDQDTFDLPLATHTLQENRRALFNDDFPSEFFLTQQLDESPGRPRSYELEEAAGVLRVFPAPSTSEDGKILFLRVARLPLTLFAIGASPTIEFPNKYHLSLADGAAALALANHDVDGESSDSGKGRRAMFEKAMDKVVTRFNRLNHAPFRFAGARELGWP